MEGERSSRNSQYGVSGVTKKGVVDSTLNGELVKLSREGYTSILSSTIERWVSIFQIYRDGWDFGNRACPKSRAAWAKTWRGVSGSNPESGLVRLRQSEDWRLNGRQKPDPEGLACWPCILFRKQEGEIWSQIYILEGTFWKAVVEGQKLRDRLAWILDMSDYKLMWWQWVQRKRTRLLGLELWDWLDMGMEERS